MTAFRMYNGSKRPDQSDPDFILRMLRNRRTATTPCTQEQYDWLIFNSVEFRFEKNKLDEYLIIENELDANAFRLKFNV